MFKGLFDGYFISASLGVTKTDPKFFEMIINKLKHAYPGIQPQDIIFFDDSQSKIDIARTLGINGQLYGTPKQVQSILIN